jgi:hypothetical protein
MLSGLNDDRRNGRAFLSRELFENLNSPASDNKGDKKIF